ncbi:cell division protein FtsH [bacterium]|nr:cell division protein FtsH [bacterium]
MDAKPEYDPVTAYHEAGHAVVALALDRPVHRVSVLPNRDRLGQCEFGKGVFRPSEDWVEREVMISLGGLAAEARHTGTYGWAEAERDLRYARRLLAETSERAAARLEKRLLAKVENLLADDDHWHAVELIAAELLTHGVISGRAARHLYERAVPQE